MIKRPVAQAVFTAFEKTSMFRKAGVDAVNELYAKESLGQFDEGNPNHPMYNNGFDYTKNEYVSLFGYKQREFMAKQYK